MSEQYLEKQRLYLTSSFRGLGVADLIMPHLEKSLNKTPTEIKVAYITTAGNLHPVDRRDWIDDARKIMQDRGWQVFDYDIADKTEAEIEAEILDKNVLFVQGGSCLYMLEQMQKCNFSEIIRRTVARGVPYIGESVGSIITGRDLSPYKFLAKDRRENPQELNNYRGVGLVNFLLRPHWNSREKYQEYKEIIINNLEKFYSISEPFILLNNNQLIYVAGKNYQIWEGK